MEVNVRAGSVKTFIADLFWIASFVTIWGLLIAFWNTWWAAMLVPMFAIMLAGNGEFLHQAAHYNLFGRSGAWNDVLGKMSAAMAGIDLKTYRAFHVKGHHRFVNTPDDPEREIYSFPEYVEKVEGWKTFSTSKKIKLLYCIASRFAKSITSALHGNSKFVRTVPWVIPIAIAGVGFLQGFLFLIPVMLVVAWYMPLFLLMFIDLLLAQSRHYGTELKAERGRMPLPEQYDISWNLKVPAIIELMLMRRNLHAEHHEYPAIHWTDARDKRTNRTLPLGKYLQQWWKNGPRVID